VPFGIVGFVAILSCYRIKGKNKKDY